MKIFTSIFFLFILHCSKSDEFHKSTINKIIPGVEVGNIRIGEKYSENLNSEKIVVIESQGIVNFIYCFDSSFTYKNVNLIGLSEDQLKIKFPNAIAAKNEDVKFPNLVIYTIVDGLIVLFSNGKIDNFCVYKIPLNNE